MRIGIDACCWANRRGFGRFTRELLTALVAVDRKNEYLFFADQETAKQHTFPDGIACVAAHTQEAPMQAASAAGRRSVRDVWALSRLVKAHRLDLFFFPAVYSYFPILNRTKVLVTIHDLIADHHPALVFPNAGSKFFWKLKQNLAVWQAHGIVTVSEYSKQQIVEYFHVPEKRIRVITEAANPLFAVLPQNEEAVRMLRRHGIEAGERFLLYVGGFSPHKNLQALVEAYHRLHQEPALADVRLVLVGDYQSDSFHTEYPALKHRVGELGLTPQVVWTGYLPDEALVHFYNAAAALVLPSFEEGFGLPAVEGMACGTPVVSSALGSLPEILGDAGRFFDPHRTETMVAALQTVLGNATLQADMRRLGLMRAKNFLWENAAQELLRIFDDFA